MTSYVTPKKNSAYIFFIALESQAAPGTFKSSPTLAAGDFKVSIDGGTLNNLATLPTNTPGGVMVKVSLSASEMNGDNITFVAIDAAGAEWYDLVVNIQTSAQQIDDLATPTNITAGTITTVTNLTNLPAAAATAAELAKVPKSDGSASWNATALAAINAEVDTALADYDAPTNAEMEARTLLAAAYFDPVVDTVAHVTLVDTTTTNTDMVAAAPTAAQNRAEMDSNSTQLAAIVADTNELQTNQGNWVTADVSALALEATSQLILEDTGTTLPAQIAGISAGSGLTAQETRDAMKLAPSAGAAAAGSIDDLLADILEDTGTTLPGLLAAELSSSSDSTTSGAITRTRGNTWTISATIGAITGYTSLWFTVKHSQDDADSDAILQIKLNSSGSDDDLIYVNGATASDSTLGAITVIDASTGAIIIAVDETVTDDMPAGAFYYDVQVLNSGAVTTPDSGKFTITADVTRSVT